MNLVVAPIQTFEVEPWLIKKHYAHRMPSVSFAFGLYEKNKLIGVITYGSPASPFLCVGVCGPEHRGKVIELNRLCIESNQRNAASILIGRSLQMLPKPKIVVSYADTAQSHIGYVYQATNFLFTGTTDERTDMASESGGHSRHNSGDSNKRVFRSAKHRYVTFIGTKYQKKLLRSCLKYEVFDYPKGESVRYDSGGCVPTQNLLFV